MINAIDVIDALPGEIEAIIESDAWFSDVVVVVAERGNLALEMARKEAVITSKSNKRGVAVIVLQLEGDDQRPNVPYGPLELRPALQIIENVELNNDASGTGKSARVVARKLRDVLKLHTPMGLAKNFTCDVPFLTPLQLPEANLVGYQVNFVTQEDDLENITKVLTPTITPGSGAVPQTVTLACGTSGASIYYTTDGSHPWSGNAAATLYTTPFTVSSAALVRARAFKSGSFGSNTNIARYT